MCCPWYDHIMKLVLSIAHNIMNIIKPTMKIITHIDKLKAAAAAASTLLLHSKFSLIRNLDLVIYFFVWESHTVFCILFEQLLQKSGDQGLYSGNSITLRQYLETFSCIQTYLWTSFLWILLKCRKHFLKRTLFLIFRIENCSFYCISNGEKTSWVIFPL